MSKIFAISIQTLCIALFIFLPWAFGTVEGWSLKIALGMILSLALCTFIRGGMTICRKSFLLLIVYLVAVGVFFGCAIFNQADIDLFSFAQTFSTDKAILWLPSSLAPQLTLGKVLLWMGWGIWAWVIMSNFSSREALTALCGVLLLSTVLLVIVAVLQKVTKADEILWFRPLTFFWDPSLPKPFVGTFVNRNHFAAYLNLIWPLCIPLYYWLLRRYNRNPVKRRDIVFLMGLLVVIFLGGIFISASRGGLLTTCFMGVLSLFLFNSFYRRIPWYLWLGGVPVIIFCAFYFGSDMIFRLSESFSGSQKGVGHDGRWLIWRDCIPLIKSSPLFGWGAGTFVVIFAFIKDPQILYRIEYAHNDYLQMLVETGFVGLTFWIMIVFAILSMIWYAQRRVESRFKKMFCRAVILSFAGILFHAVIDFPFQMGGLSLTLAGLVGLAFACARRPSRTRVDALSKSSLN